MNTTEQYIINLRENFLTFAKDITKNRDNFLNSVGSQMNDFSSNLRKSIQRDCENKSKEFNDKIEALDDVNEIEKFSVGNETTAFYANECEQIEQELENVSGEI